MDRYLKEVGDRIRQARLKKGINQAQLAEIIDKTPPYVSNIEMGKQNMSIIVLYKIVKALDVSADWILAHDTPETVAIVACVVESFRSGFLPRLGGLLQTF